jgi:hypothetical protein
MKITYGHFWTYSAKTFVSSEITFSVGKVPGLIVFSLIYFVLFLYIVFYSVVYFYWCSPFWLIATGKHSNKETESNHVIIIIIMCRHHTQPSLLSHFHLTVYFSSRHFGPLCTKEGQLFFTYVTAHFSSPSCLAFRDGCRGRVDIPYAHNTTLKCVMNL